MQYALYAIHVVFISVCMEHNIIVVFFLQLYLL